MIIIENLKHIYPGSRRQKARTAIHDLNLRVAEGTFCILSGPNGSGKSTLFRILCGVAQPSAGNVTIGGHNLARDPQAVRQIMGVVFQSPAVDKQLSVMENLRLHGAMHGLRGAAFEARLQDALSWSDIGERLGDRVDTLSGGLARQVELAKVLLTSPRVLLLDEPTTGLDPASRRAFLGALKRLQAERGMTVLMTSHVFSEAEDADAVAIMRDGHLLAHDTPQTLRALVGHKMVVVQSRTPAVLAQAINEKLGLMPLIHGDELRFEDIPADGPVALIERLLHEWQSDILSVAVKQPTLEDVFIHVTGKTAGADDGATHSPAPLAEAL